jgi:hypothetical protein
MARYDSTRLNRLISEDAALHEEIRKERLSRRAAIQAASDQYENDSIVRLSSIVRLAQRKLRDLKNRSKIPANPIIELDVTGFSSSQLRSILGNLQALFP